VEEARRDAGLTSEAERIRELNDAIARADVDAATRLMQPDVVWEHNLGAGTPEEGVYRGRESVSQLIERLVEGWDYQRPEPGEIRELSSGVYLVRGELHSKHVASATEIVSPYRQRLVFRDGLLAKTHVSTGEESDNLATVRRFVEAFNRLDLDSVREEVHPDVQIDEWPAAPDPRSYQGLEGIQQAIDTWFESWEWMTVTIEHLEELGDSVLVTQYQRAKGRGSAVEVEITSYNVYTFRDGLVHRIRLFTEREPALEAAGMTTEYEEEGR
jgi:ketosteroid isomerase-like protein